MAWKTDDNGGVVLQDGNPVWVNDAGEEKPVDYPGISKSLADTTRESIERKNKLRAMESKYAKFDGIEDLDSWHSEATKALEMMKNAPDKDKEIEERIAARLRAATDPLNAKLTEAQKRAEQLDAELQYEAVGNAFARSSYVKDKLIDPALAADLFAKRFARKDGLIVGLEANGEPMFGQSGIASFDEALCKMVEASPYKGVLIKGSEASGGGASSTVRNTPTKVDKTKMTGAQLIALGLKTNQLGVK